MWPGIENADSTSAPVGAVSLPARRAVGNARLRKPDSQGAADTFRFLISNRQPTRSNGSFKHSGDSSRAKTERVKADTKCRAE
jgi:hypothetical protein